MTKQEFKRAFLQDVGYIVNSHKLIHANSDHASEAECVNCGCLIHTVNGSWVHMASEEMDCESVDPHATYSIAMPAW